MNQPLKTLVVLLFFGSSIHSQTNKLNLGVELGVNSTTVLQSQQKKYDSSSPGYGYHAGLALRWNLTNHFSLQTGISMEHKKYFWQHNTSDGIYTSTYSKSKASLDYLTLPVLARFNFGEKVNFFFNAGFYVGYLAKQSDALVIDSYSSFQLNSTHTHTEENQNNLVSHNRVDLGLIGGIGLGVPIKKHWYLSLEFRNHFGFMDITGGYPSGTAPFSNTANLLLGVSYKLGLQKK